MTFTHVSLSVLLGLYSVFSYINNDITFWINVIILFLIILIWGIGASATFIINAEYLPPKVIGLAFLTINLGRAL